jgi:hypothetical protein
MKYLRTTNLPGHSMILCLLFPLLVGCAKYSIAMEPTAGSGRITQISQAFWNSWFQETGFQNAPTKSIVEVGKTYTFTFDLSPYSYGNEDPNVVVHLPSAELLDELNKLPLDVLTVYVRPVIVGRGIVLLPGEEELKQLDLDLNKLRRPDLSHLGRERLFEYSSRVQAGKITINVTATEPGCAAIALSIWNRTLDRPIDDYIHTVAIHNAATPSPNCEPNKTRDQKAPSRHLSLLWQDPDSAADAALHFFELKLGDTIYKAAVYGEKRSMVAWAVSNSLSSLLSDINFLATIDEARNTGDYSKSGEKIFDALFSADTPNGKRQARYAQKQLEALPDGSVLFVRMVDVSGRNLFLPLGSLKIGPTFLGDRITVLQPLPQQTYRQPDICIADNWAMGLPDRLESVSLATYSKFLIKLDGIISSRLSTIGKLKTYLTSESATSSPEGLLLLAHHGNGNLWYDKKSNYVTFSDIDRQYARGSIAVVAACGVGNLAAGERRLALLTRLNSHGIDAVILSPYEVPAELGVALAMHFENQISAAYENMKKNAQLIGPTLGQIFDATLKSIDKDTEFEKVNAKAKYEFLLAGNNGLRLCLKP